MVRSLPTGFSISRLRANLAHARGARVTYLPVALPDLRVLEDQLDAALAQADRGAADEVHGESGDDFIFAMVGNDRVFGDGQNDSIVAGHGADWVSGGTGDDGILGDDGLIFASRWLQVPLYLGLVLVLGLLAVKFYAELIRDIVDIWALLFDEYNALAYFDPAAGKKDYKTLPAAESLAAARNRGPRPTDTASR